MKFDDMKSQVFHMWPAKIISLMAAILMYVFVNLFALETYEVTVPIQYRLPPGMVQGMTYKKEAVLVFRSDRETISELRSKNFAEGDFEFLVDLQDQAEPGPYRLTPRIQLLSGSDDLRHFGFQKSEPALITGVLEPAHTRQVMVIPVVRGQPAQGFELGDIAVSPEKVTIQGPRSLVESIGSVETETVNSEDQDQSFLSRTRIRLPDPLLGIVDTAVVNVRVNIRSGQEVVVYNNVVIEAFGLDDSLEILTPLPAGTIRVRQEQRSDLSLGAMNLPAVPRMLIDLGKVTGPGIYDATILPLVDSSFTVLEVQPQNFTVEIGAVSPETESPADGEPTRP